MGDMFAPECLWGNCKAVLFLDDTALLTFFKVGRSPSDPQLHPKAHAFNQGSPFATKGSLIQRGSEPKPWSYTDATNNELMQSKGLVQSSSSAFPMPWPRCTNKKNMCVSLLSASIKRFKHCMYLAKCVMTTCLNLSNREMSYLHCKAHVIIFFPHFFKIRMHII